MAAETQEGGGEEEGVSGEGVECAGGGMCLEEM